MLILETKNNNYSLILWRSTAFDFHKYKECTQQMNCVSLGSGTHVYVPACKHTHADITPSDKYDIHVSKTRQKKKSLFFPSPEGTSSTRRAGLKQDVGITARI